ncbi:MAG: hypothetical protein IKI90_09465 [Treponema sp.]|nr:hypothetical protein [Treponema sp.]
MADKYFAFQWHITDECDQRCKHCYIFAEGQAGDARGEQGSLLNTALSAHSHPALVSMNWEQMKTVFFNALDFCEHFDRLPYFTSLAEILFFIRIFGIYWSFSMNTRSLLP